jgi:hypothetical protein
MDREKGQYKTKVRLGVTTSLRVVGRSPNPTFQTLHPLPSPKFEDPRPVGARDQESIIKRIGHQPPYSTCTLYALLYHNYTDPILLLKRCFSVIRNHASEIRS